MSTILSGSTKIIVISTPCERVRAGRAADHRKSHHALCRHDAHAAPGGERVTAGVSGAGLADTSHRSPPRAGAYRQWESRGVAGDMRGTRQTHKACPGARTRAQPKGWADVRSSVMPRLA